MICLVNPPHGTLHPAVVISPTLALPLYHKEWGVSSRVANWRQAGLTSPSYVILSQPWRTFRRRRILGTLDPDDRDKLLHRAALGRPELLPELRDL
jgi:hypothetical protein